MDDDLVIAEEAAKAIGLNKYFVYRLAGSGQIPCYRAGRAIRFSIAELRDWMRGQATVKANSNGTK